jgi:hemerythrin-like domain-containing protein
MNAAANPVPAADDAPVQGFSRCHEGIVAQLKELERLPALAEAAAQARAIAAAIDDFFADVVINHHADEEKDLFPAVIASAADEAEREQVRALAERLTQEHRGIEQAWRALRGDVRALAHGRAASLDAPAVAALVAAYRAHAGFEEESFLPLAARILGRDGRHMAALGISLHARHAMPEVLRRFGTHL